MRRGRPCCWQYGYEPAGGGSRAASELPGERRSPGARGLAQAVRRQSETLRPLAHSHIASSTAALAASKLPSRLHDPTPHTFVETALLSKYVIVASAGSAWRELDSRSGLAFGPSPSGLHRARSKRETQLPSKGGHPSAWGTPRLAPHSGLGHKTTFPGQFGGSARPSARWLIAMPPAVRPPSPHPSSHHVCMTPSPTPLSRPPS